MSKLHRTEIFNEITVVSKLLTLISDIKDFYNLTVLGLIDLLDKII